MSVKQNDRRFLRIGATHRDLIEVPPYFFASLIADRFFNLHPKKPYIATVNPLFCCWIEAISSSSTLPVECRLRFSVRQSLPIDPGAVGSSFYLLLQRWIFTVEYKSRDGVKEPQYTVLWDWHNQVYA